MFSPGVFLLLVQRRRIASSPITSSPITSSAIASSPAHGVKRPCPAAALQLGSPLGLGLESPRLLLRVVEFDQRTGQRFL